MMEIMNAFDGDLVTALIECQQEFAPLKKSGTNPHFKNKFVPLHEVLESVLPVLNKHGLAVSQFPTNDDGVPSLTTYLLHTSGSYIAHNMPLQSAKSDPQAQGSAITYARRYALMSILGVVGDEDDDGAAAVKPAAKKGTMQGDMGPQHPLEQAKTRLRAAIKKANANGQDYAWVAQSTNIDKITEAAVELELK